MANFFERFFGYLTPTKKPDENIKSPVAVTDDGAFVIDTSGLSQHVNFSFEYSDEVELIEFYRDMALYSDVDYAIDEIMNEMFVISENKPPVSINLDVFKEEEIPNEIKEKIRQEFDVILQLLNFNANCFDIGKRFYTDGKMSFYKIPHEDKTKGLQEVRYIDSKKIKKIRVVKTVPHSDESNNYTRIVEDVEEYFLFNADGVSGMAASQTGTIGSRIDVSAIAHVHSGILSPDGTMIFSWLHKAIKPYNQLKLLEDSVVIYRLTRSPERRIFYIDTGNLPPPQAEEYVRSLMNVYRNNETYDSSTGNMNSQNLYMSMIDDLWIPKTGDGKGTTVDTLQGGENLGEIEDVVYFQRKLFKAMNVPESRMERDAGFSLGRSNEITRDEIKFKKFINKIQKRFSGLFVDLLGTQLILKNIVTQEEWDNVKDFIGFTYESDSHFYELKEAEMVRERIALAREAIDLGEDFFSKEYIAKNILKFTEEEIQGIQHQSEIETNNAGDIVTDDENDFEFELTDDETGNTPKIDFDPKIKPINNLIDINNSRTASKKEEEEEEQVKQG